MPRDSVRSHWEIPQAAGAPLMQELFPFFDGFQ